MLVGSLAALYRRLPGLLNLYLAWLDVGSRRTRRVGREVDRLWPNRRSCWRGRREDVTAADQVTVHSLEELRSGKFIEVTCR